ncbi:MAG: glycosyltransferase family 2 protein, partial [Parcubacteria group bacterium]|nr:glycosyltransferase family 2 protein [Parcubacteria group bacterium]
MEKPIVSIITPAYDAERYLEDAIESVRAQTFQDWEMIIVDDGSRDATAQIAKRYAERDSRIKYSYQENQRMASARNVGIQCAVGKYVAFLDADNLFLPQRLERQVGYLEAHQDCGVCYGKIRHFVQRKERMLYDNPQPSYSGEIFRELLKQNFINLLSAVVRKEALDRYGAFPQGWKACDEHFMWVNLSYRGVRFCALDEFVGLERLHPESDSRRPSHLRDTAEGFLKMLDMLEAQFTPEEKVRFTIDMMGLKYRWGYLLVIGKLLANTVLGKFLMPFYLWRRNRHYRPISRPFHGRGSQPRVGE